MVGMTRAGQLTEAVRTGGAIFGWAVRRESRNAIPNRVTCLGLQVLR